MFKQWLFKTFILPKDWHLYHGGGCGSLYRGCSPTCPKDIYEETGKWLGHKRFFLYFKQILRALRNY